MFKYPRIIPIVLYTGNQKWTVNTSFAESVVGDQYVYGNLEQDSLEEIIRIIEMNEEVENMSTVQERIAEEFYNNRIQARKEGRIEGRLEGIKEKIKTMIRNMLENNIEEEKILKCTNAKKEDIEKINKFIEK